MRDSFVSVSHKLLEHNFNNMNFPPIIKDFVMDSYKEAKVNISSKLGWTNPIDIKRGVKQGCPLSPLLSNSCMDPLIRKLNSIRYKELGCKINLNIEDIISCQACADDVLLFAPSYGNLLKFSILSIIFSAFPELV
jgi:hypothetical protein